MEGAKRGNIESEGKKGQFYIISAVIIIFVIIGFAVVTNYVTVKKAPEKFYDIGRDLSEGARVVEYSEYSTNPNINVDQQIANYIGLFANYTSLNTGENFNMLIIYGNIGADKNISVKKYNSTSTGGVSISFGGAPINAQVQGTLSGEQGFLAVNPDNTVNVTLKSGNSTIVTRVPVLQNNNFAFVMTTSDGFNDYVQKSVATTEEQKREAEE
jgi:hypothetical protein